MLTINNIFDIANSAMTTNQAAMNTVSQNVANVNTPFYNNETPILSEAPAVVGAPYTYGTGVNLTQVQRSTNAFVQSEVNNETTQNSYYTNLYQGLNQIQNLFNDQSGSGFSSAISAFFNDFQNVANNPSNTAQRTALLSDAKSLTGDINNAYTTIMNTVSSTNISIKGIIPEVNSLTSQIASLNQQVTYAQNTGSNANELRDERMNAINQLSKLVNISYYENNNGKINISIGGTPLVLSDSSFNLSTKINSGNVSSLNIMWNGPAGSQQDITQNVTGGSLGAYVNFEQAAAPSYISQLNSLSAAITDNVNSLQYNGYGLDGSTGSYFFNPNLTTSAGSGVTDATINTGYVADPSKLTGDKYSIQATGGGAFTVTNNTTGQTLSSSEVSVSSAANKYGQNVYTIGFDGVSVNITGTSTTGTAPANGDTFTVNQLTTNPAFTMSVNPNLSTSQVAAASAVATAVNPNNTGNATISAGSVINPTTYTNGTNIPGSNEGGQYTIKYTGPGTTGTGDFTITNNTTNLTQTINNIPITTNSSGQSEYSIFFGNQTFSGSNGAQAENFHVTITGTPQANDSFTANVLSPQSTGLSLTQMNTIGLSGNNENALNLAALQNNNVPVNGTDTTISTYYSGIVSNIGTQAQSANTNYTNSSSVLTNLKNQLSSSVGVNMNQQMTDLVNYQNSYQAAAAITHSAEAIMTALLSIVP
ncbi:MAG: flagellar hook-associated protein FlgK [Deltaproteobacteria bacterium]|nr:flagellar hook-associated protein FlgK [Deltaproteobacteria bacterium]MCL5891850.1 flagellar hook-associated protein FlgK [Deltaproteobacteria bacterium]